MSETEGDKIEPGSAAAKNTFQKAAERHYDYYVGLDQAGTLPEEDRPNLELAKRRKKAGKVKP